MKDISMLAEDTVRLITSIFDDITNPFVSTSETEYKSFIDGSISYFTTRLKLIDDMTQNMILQISSIKRKLMMNIDNLNYPMKVRMPDKEYFSLPNYGYLFGAKLFEWNIKTNQSEYNLAYRDVPYDKIIKLMFDKKIKKINKLQSDINDLLYKDKEIKDSNEMKYYLNSFIFPKKDLDNIKKFVDNYIKRLIDLKNVNIESFFTDTELKTLSYNSKYACCIKMVDVNNTIMKRMINALLDIINGKVSFVMYTPSPLNEAYDFRFGHNPTYLEEALLLEQYGYSTDKFLNINNKQIQGLKSFLAKDIEAVMNKYNEMVDYINRTYDINYLNTIDKARLPVQSAVFTDGIFKTPSLPIKVEGNEEKFKSIFKNKKQILDKLEALRDDTIKKLSNPEFYQSDVAYSYLYGCRLDHLLVNIKQEMDRLEKTIMIHSNIAHTFNDDKFTGLISKNTNYNNDLKEKIYRYNLLKKQYNDLIEQYEFDRSDISLPEQVIESINDFYNYCNSLRLD